MSCNMYYFFLQMQELLAIKIKAAINKEKAAINNDGCFHLLLCNLHLRSVSVFCRHDTRFFLKYL